MPRCLSIALPGLVAASPTLKPQYYDHVGLVVKDTNLTAQRWAALYGVEVPGFFNNAGPDANLTWHGVHTDANILGAYFGCDGNSMAELEILQPADADLPSFWLDHYKLSGSSPFYLGFATDDWDEQALDAHTTEFTSVGCPTRQVGYWWSGGGARGCYHYMDCQDTTFGANIEVMTRSNCASSAPNRELPSTMTSNHRVHTRPIFPSTIPVLTCERMMHVALVVPNISASAAQYAKAFGAELPSIKETHAGDTTYKGASTEAIARWVELQLKSDFALRIYQPIGIEASWWNDALQRHGPSILLNSYGVDDLEETVKQFATHGFGVLQRGPGYAYIDSLEELGLVVEVTDRKPVSALQV